MTHDHNFFTPEHVDEQVDRLSQHPVRDQLLHSQGEGSPSQVGADLVEDLNAYYQVERQENIASLASAWQRISARQSGEREHMQAMPTQPLPTTPAPEVSQERSRTMRSTVHNASRGRNFSRQLGLIAAMLIAALLVGSLVVIVKLSHQQNATSAPGLPAKIAPTATSTPPPVPGKLLYTTPANQTGFESLSWSPDSKRIASATADPGGVQFWDATTGAHRVTVQLPGGPSEWATSLSWSPDSQDVAVATNEHLLIVNGQTGKIIHSYAANVPTAMPTVRPTAMPTLAPVASNATSSGPVLHSRLLPNGSGEGYRATAWSPDGHLIASTISLVASGEVQVVNPQTGATNFTFSLGSPNNISELAWSSDGQYIAATTWNTQPSNLTQPYPTQPINKIVVWNISTRQMVFQHNNFQGGSDQPITWQPGSHNLAFVGTINNNSTATLEIWNATTGKLVKSFGPGAGAMAWSPDGRYLAYAADGGKNAVNVVIIIEATTGKQFYVYKGHHLSISAIAWSPNGQYIASAEGNTEGSMVAQVWTA